MKSVNIVYLFSVLCVLVSPSLSAPADDATPEVPPKNVEQNELDGIIDTGVDTFQPDVKPIEKPVKKPVEKPTDVKPVISGSGHGSIFSSGTEGPFKCYSITCPPGTSLCEYDSTLSPDGKTSTVLYKCYSKVGQNRTLLHEETKTEPAKTGFGSSIFTDVDEYFSKVHDFMKSVIDSFPF